MSIEIDLFSKLFIRDSHFWLIVYVPLGIDPYRVYRYGIVHFSKHTGSCSLVHMPIVLDSSRLVARFLVVLYAPTPRLNTALSMRMVAFLVGELTLSLCFSILFFKPSCTASVIARFSLSRLMIRSHQFFMLSPPQAAYIIEPANVLALIVSKLALIISLSA